MPLLRCLDCTGSCAGCHCRTIPRIAFYTCPAHHAVHTLPLFTLRLFCRAVTFTHCFTLPTPGPHSCRLRCTVYDPRRLHTFAGWMPVPGFPHHTHTTDPRAARMLVAVRNARVAPHAYLPHGYAHLGLCAGLPTVARTRTPRAAIVARLPCPHARDPVYAPTHTRTYPRRLPHFTTPLFPGFAQVPHSTRTFPQFTGGHAPGFATGFAFARLR